MAAKVYRNHWSNRHSSHVCPECRTVNRHGGICTVCNRPTLGLGERWRVPKKNDDKGWKQIEKKLAGFGPFPRDKTAVVIDSGTPEDFKRCTLDYLESK